jgi:hypothetical protein
MIDKMKDLMIRYRIGSEAEIFTTKLAFNLGDENFSKYIGDPGCKDEDAEKAMNTRMEELIRFYRKEFETLVKKDGTEHDWARAVYFATYYHVDNRDYSYFVFDNSLKRPALKDFE